MSILELPEVHLLHTSAMKDSQQLALTLTQSSSDRPPSSLLQLLPLTVAKPPPQQQQPQQPAGKNNNKGNKKNILMGNDEAVDNHQTSLNNNNNNPLNTATAEIEIPAKVAPPKRNQKRKLSEENVLAATALQNNDQVNKEELVIVGTAVPLEKVAIPEGKRSRTASVTDGKKEVSHHETEKSHNNVNNRVMMSPLQAHKTSKAKNVFPKITFIYSFPFS
jgi:hypothetical protein